MIALDARGHGASAKPHEPAAYGGGAMATDLGLLLDIIGTPSVHLAGYSMGAIVSLTASAADQRISWLVVGGIGAAVVELGAVDTRAVARGAITAALLADDAARGCDPGRAGADHSRRSSQRGDECSVRRRDRRLPGRARATVRAIADELTKDGRVLRYQVDQTDDGLSGEEGTFTICSFWLVSALAEIGEHRRARDLCERVLSHASPLLLYAEEIDAQSGRHLGNFPQAFTHLALINAAMHVITFEQETARLALEGGAPGALR